MIKIVLPILYYNDNTNKKKLIDTPIKLSDYDVHNMIFYNIDAISIHREDFNYTNICAGNEIYIAKAPIKEIEKHLDMFLQPMMICSAS